MKIDLGLKRSNFVLCYNDIQFFDFKKCVYDLNSVLCYNGIQFFDFKKRVYDFHAEEKNV